MSILIAQMARGMKEVKINKYKNKKDWSFEVNGIPVWEDEYTDNVRTMEIKTYKNIISTHFALKNEKVFIPNRIQELYLKAIKRLKEMGEKYP